MVVYIHLKVFAVGKVVQILFLRTILVLATNMKQILEKKRNEREKRIMILVCRNMW